MLISGANRGIGLSLVLAFLDRFPSSVVFAGARDPSKATHLNQLTKKNPNNLYIVELVVDDADSNKAATEKVKQVTDRLDIVIANAGIPSPPEPIHTDNVNLYKTAFEVNTLGPLHLYQATHPLLIASRKTDSTPSKDIPVPKFFITSSGLGSMGGYIPFYPATAHGASKAAVNYLAVAIHHQTEDVGAVIIPYHPGNVITYVLGPKEAEAYAAIPDVPQGITPEQCAKEYVDLIERSSRAEHGGRFWAQGFAEPYPW